MDADTVYILGSGMSLDGFDYKKLDGRRVIAVNDAGLRQYPQAHTLISTDAGWWRRRSGELGAFRGDRIICTEPEVVSGVHDERLVIMRRLRQFGLSDETGILHGIFTGVHAAINLAAHELARRIVLLGVDLRADDVGGRKYTYPGEERTTIRTDRQFEQMRRALESCALPLARKGISVLNASPISALTCWPLCAPHEAFK